MKPLKGMKGALNANMCDPEYPNMYRAVAEYLHSMGITGTDAFIESVIHRIRDDADEDWNNDDVAIAIQNELNAAIEKLYA